jgi:hypothetical protein
VQGPDSEVGAAAWLCARARALECDVTARRGMAEPLFHLTVFDQIFLQKLELKCTQVLIAKL